MDKLNNNTLKNRLSPSPTGLVLASLLIWGWQTDYFYYAFLMGLMLEMPHFIKWRIDFSDKDVNQLADLSGIIFFILTVYVFVNYSFQGIYKILELIPFILMLLMLVQNYGTQNGIKTSALFISIRRLGNKAGADVLYVTNISMPYVFICLISASTGYKFSDYFFSLSALTITWLLFKQRTQHFRIISWLAIIALVMFMAFLTQSGLKQLQNHSEAFFLALFEQYGWKSIDPERTATSIGSMGRLKLSDRIIFRVKPDKPSINPLYFREASYSSYQYGTWRNPKTDFDIIQKEPNKNRWGLNKGFSDTEKMDIAIYLQKQSAIIPVPDNINSLVGKDLIQVETNPYGSTRVEAREGWINYRLGLSTKVFIEAPPSEAELSIPLNYQDDFQLIATQLDLYTKTPKEIIKTVEHYFKENFYYSITQNQRYPKSEFLTKFLFKDKKGHCEYFATATALLLREVGIPTRYTIGYSVQEYSDWQNMYLVRARHAHAWLKYYVDGKWYNMDTTPSTWAPMEAEDRTILEPFMDLVSWLRYKTTSSNLEPDKKSNYDWVLWLLIPLFSYIAWRFYTKQRIEQKTNAHQVNANLERYGIDSPLYALINKLEQEIDSRKPGETLFSWITRILPQPEAQQYFALINLHNSYRFNPASNKQQDKESLEHSLNAINQALRKTLY